MKKLMVLTLAFLLFMACASCAQGSELSFEGRAFAFRTTDLDGSIADSEALFSANRITMVNVWATWCGPCVGELPELAAIHEQLQGMDCGIVGILVDTDTAKGVEQAKALVEQNSITYPMLLMSDDMADIMNEILYIPTTFFVDQSGTIVGDAIIGATPDDYIPTIKSLLENIA